MSFSMTSYACASVAFQQGSSAGMWTATRRSSMCKFVSIARKLLLMWLYISEVLYKVLRFTKHFTFVFDSTDEISGLNIVWKRFLWVSSFTTKKCWMALIFKMDYSPQCWMTLKYKLGCRPHNFGEQWHIREMGQSTHDDGHWRIRWVVAPIMRMALI